MKNIFKILMVLILPLLLLNACRDDADKNWTSPEKTIHLYNTTLSSNTLYPTMDNNTFRLVWDDANGTTGTYTVQFSKTADFKTPIVFGTSQTNSLTKSIASLNTALLQAGYSPYAQTMLFIRVANGNNVSNTVSVGVTPYPVSVPVITNPVAGQSVVLDAANPTSNALTVTWTDYDYGTTVNYTIEIAPKGSTNFVVAGTATEKQLAMTNFELNEAVQKISLPNGVSSEVDIHVIAKTESPGGVITKTSDVVTFKVTPYQPAYKDFYLVGGGTAVGWNAGGAQLLHNAANISEIYTYLSNNGDFRFLGQQDWNPINYSLNAPGINDAYKYFNTWTPNLQPNAPENMTFTGDSGVYKMVIDQNAKSISITPSSISVLPTNLYLVGSINGWDAGAALPMTQVGDGVYEYTIAIPDGAEFKFIGQQSWGDQEWANIHTGGNSGFLGPKGDNNNIQYNGGGSTYKITANIKMGTYKVVPQ
ncbi:SusE domain-containing protein [Chryseobacterium koreense]|mgnify:CR=1 FL=1|uniref:SusE domain-containing protein n=1 Tax=Chryseobacterium koreense TaxID=232216 RepID=UPI0026E952B3|nr:SusE domain-containing protein [Chryseobacterium koreense]